MTGHRDLSSRHNPADTDRPAAVGRRDALSLAADIRAGATDPAAVLERAIDRIATLNPRLNAVVSTRFDAARAEVEAGLPDGPLRGVPIVIKNLGTDVAGQPATCLLYTSPTRARCRSGRRTRGRPARAGRGSR